MQSRERIVQKLSLANGSNGSGSGHRSEAERSFHPTRTFIHSSRDASLRYPNRSGSCSISHRQHGRLSRVVEARGGGGAARAMKVIRARLKVSETWVRTISRSPITREANCAVPLLRSNGPRKTEMA